MNDNTLKNIQISEIYHDPKTGYRGKQDIARKTKINPKVIDEYLKTQDVYTKHYPKVQNFQRRRFFTPGIDKIWQCDLVFMEPKWAKENDGYLYLNFMIDTFSKYLWVIALKTKKSSEVLESFKKVFKQGRICESLNSDLGSEYIARDVQNYFKSQNIHWYATQNETKAMIVERCARTIQQMMHKYLTDNETTKWIDVLDDLVFNYNNSFHSSIKMTPKEASNPKNHDLVYENLYGNESRLGPLFTKNTKISFKPGDMVRTYKFGTKFDRGYKPTFADEILYIKEVIGTNPPTYKLVDYHDKAIKGSYYDNELVKYNKQEEDFEYEYILQTKKTKDPNKFKAYVKWKGYPDKFNSWVELTEEQIKDSIILKPIVPKRKNKTNDTRTKRNVAKAK